MCPHFNPINWYCARRRMEVSGRDFAEYFCCDATNHKKCDWYKGEIDARGNRISNSESNTYTSIAISSGDKTHKKESLPKRLIKSLIYAFLAVVVLSLISEITGVWRLLAGVNLEIISIVLYVIFFICFFLGMGTNTDKTA